MRIPLDRLLLALAVLIAAIHIPGTALGWYFTYPWLDIPMHMAGGLFAGLLFFYIFFERGFGCGTGRRGILPGDMGFMPTAFLALGFVALIGVGWEFYEYLAGAGTSHPGNYADTLLDLLNDLAGGGVGVLVARE